MRTLLLLSLACTFLGAAPLAAQYTGARMTASATVVEPGGVHTGAARVGRASNGQLEVATPLEIRGRVPTVVSVVEGDAVGGSLLASGTHAPRPAAAEPSHLPTSATTVRTAVPLHGAGADGAPRVLRYVVSHIH